MGIRDILHAMGIRSLVRLHRSGGSELDAIQIINNTRGNSKIDIVFWGINNVVSKKFVYRATKDFSRISRPEEVEDLYLFSVSNLGDYLDYLKLKFVVVEVDRNGKKARFRLSFFRT